MFVGRTFDHTRLYIFNKTNAYANGTDRTIVDVPIETAVTNSPASTSTIVPATTYDTSLSTLYLLNMWNSRLVDTNGTNGWLRLWKITGTPSAPVFTNTLEMFHTSAWADNAGTNGIAPQTNSSVKIWASDSRLHNLIYRNGSLWTAHTVFLPDVSPTKTAAQWWEIPLDGREHQVSRITGADQYFAFPTIAVNKFNDALVGFTYFSPTGYASAAYTFRAHSDSPNTMRPFSILTNGLGVYFKTPQTRNRWGDYSATHVDPINDADFWTLQQYADAPVSTNNGGGRWAVWWANLVMTKPSNDNFADALQLTGSEGSSTGSVFRATIEVSEPNHASSLAQRTIWYKWSAPTNGSYMFDTILSPFPIDTVLAVYTGSSLSGLTEVTSNDNVARNSRSRVVFSATTNVTYYVVIAAKSSSSENTDATVLSWIPAPPPDFVTEPSDVNILAGESFVLLSLASGAPTISYQWQTNGVNISGGNYANHTNTNPQSASTNTPTTYEYRVIASNYVGTATSSVAYVTVYPNASATLKDFVVTNTSFMFQVTGATSYVYIAQTSTNLIDWESIKTNAVSFWVTNFPSTNQPYRFFRAIY
jgi:hypothetical protein